MNDSSRLPSFFDLREFASASRPSAAEAGGLVRRRLELPPGPVTVGALHVAQGAHAETVDADEFVVVCEGGVAVRRWGGTGAGTPRLTRASTCTTAITN